MDSGVPCNLLRFLITASMKSTQAESFNILGNLSTKLVRPRESAKYERSDFGSVDKS